MAAVIEIEELIVALLLYKFKDPEEEAVGKGFFDKGGSEGRIY